jgi:glycosyltransferase involved in cell wall biosynthesis
MRRAARGRAWLLGDLLGRSFAWLERGIVRSATAVVAISEDFEPLLLRWGVPREAIHVVPNWAPLDELPARPRDNAWAREHGLTGRRVFLYAGTLGIKHNPDLLLQLALRYRDADVSVVVCSEGKGAAWLQQKIAERPDDLAHLVVLPYQRWDAMPDVLASGDVLVVILEPEAGAFSVPSKILAYHCAGRPILAALPPSNLAARIIEGAGSGAVVDPRDTRGFVAAGERLAEDAEQRAAAGRAARAYAEETFDIRRIAERFDEIFAELATAETGRTAAAGST